MKILFICGSLEPGRDGVGDYTRRLAGECRRQGEDCRIIALNDRKLQTHDSVFEFQQDGETSIECLRLPSTLAWRKRLAVARKWRESYNPEILSLQFVPYSFHEKGIPFWLPSRLRQIGDEANWHIMFHELWIGPSSPLCFRRRLVAFAQKQIVRLLIRHLRAGVVCSHAAGYLTALEEFNIKPLQLKLFSNIRLMQNVPEKTNNDFFDIVHFGAVRRNWNCDTAVDLMKSWAAISGKPPRLILIGPSGAMKDETWANFERAGITVDQKGVVADDVVSCTLLMSDVGISGIYPGLIEKSGSVAAMLEHGLPVFVVNDQPVDAETASRIRAEYPQVRFGADLECFSTSDFTKTEKKVDTLQRTAEVFLRHLTPR